MKPLQSILLRGPKQLPEGFQIVPTYIADHEILQPMFRPAFNVKRERRDRP